MTLERGPNLGDMGPSDPPEAVSSAPSGEPEPVFWGGAQCLCVSPLSSVVGCAAQQSLRTVAVRRSSSRYAHRAGGASWL